MSRALKRAMFVALVAVTFCTETRAQEKDRFYFRAFADIENTVTDCQKKISNIDNPVVSENGRTFVRMSTTRPNMTYDLLRICDFYTRAIELFSMIDSEHSDRSRAARIVLKQITRDLRMLELRPKVLEALKHTEKNAAVLAEYARIAEATKELITMLRPLKDRTKPETQRLDEFIRRKY